MVDLIRKKRDGFELSEKELSFIIEGYVQGKIPDYQMSAWAMAIYFQDMTPSECASLTKAMSLSGEYVDLSSIEGIKVDKHSTGGVGDKTTLVLAPLVASLGIPVAKMSGRGLGHTGGTIDKLESIPGFRAEQTTHEFIRLVNRNQIAIVSQTTDLTPADKMLYQLRDVTATVESIPLLASSIMSKKIASGSDAIVLDVKTGSGAFMHSFSEAKRLAKTMVDIGKLVGKQTVAVISNMDEPLGHMIGNALEVKEAVETLKGEGPQDLEELCLVLGSHMLLLAKRVDTLQQARSLLKTALQSGRALEKFKTFVESQGGDPTVIDDLSTLPAAAYQIPVRAKTDGYVTNINAKEIGMSAMLLGAGRSIKDTSIDHSVGVELKKKIGSKVKSGDVLAILHANEKKEDRVIERVFDAFSIHRQKPKQHPLIYEHISYL